VRQVGSLSFDTRQRELRIGGQLVHLTPKSVQLLEVMLREPGRVVPRAELEHALWGSDIPERDALRSQLHLLRKALADAGFDGIETVHGVGVRLRVDAA
jgi:DNA-binding winged helix-turn-helix (wHTH) protein